MQNRKKLPVGIDSFEKMIRQNFCYVDKTQLITELLCNWGEVNLFTRPRRFGKSLKDTIGTEARRFPLQMCSLMNTLDLQMMK